MKTIFLFINILLLSIPSFSQSIDHQVIGSTGNYKDAGPVKASSTTGETVIGTLGTSTLVVTQGFQQPLPSDFQVGISNKVPEGIKINVYPNPTMDKVTLEFSLTVSFNIVIKIYNESGQLVYSKNELNIQNHSKQELDFSKLPTGYYFIQVRSTDGKLNQGYKVQKKNL